tara:strand:+ start:234 stop:482 length:249 start_codon:yes stop_codon:yes gene_type:complete
VEVDLDEWSNLPLLLPKYLIKNQKHLISLIDYTKERTADETTASLRTYIVTELEKINKKSSKFKKETNEEIMKIKKNKELLN